MALVEFNRQVFELEEGANLLTALEQRGLNPAPRLRCGVCQGCLVQVLEGQINPRAQEGLSAHQTAQGLAMACVCSVSGTCARKPLRPAPPATPVKCCANAG